jgi:hypothetical protein
MVVLVRTTPGSARNPAAMRSASSDVLDRLVPSNTCDAFQLSADLLVSKLGGRDQWLGGAKRDVNDRARGGIHLLHLGTTDPLGKVGQETVDLVALLVRSRKKL